MTTFLFWNLNRRPLQHLVSMIAIERKVDVLILAEYKIGIADLLTALNDKGSVKEDRQLSS